VAAAAETRSKTTFDIEFVMADVRPAFPTEFAEE
jgi:hypothetical protein